MERYTHVRKPIAVYGAKPRGRDGYLSAGYPTPDVTAASGASICLCPETRLRTGLRATQKRRRRTAQARAPRTIPGRDLCGPAAVEWKKPAVHCLRQRRRTQKEDRRMISTASCLLVAATKPETKRTWGHYGITELRSLSLRDDDNEIDNGYLAQRNARMHKNRTLQDTHTVHSPGSGWEEL